jgi:hypothetical protein
MATRMMGAYPAPEFPAGLDWINTGGKALTLADLRGKLVLLDSLRFSTVQKIIAYLTLGVLLLAVGFFYQRFKDKLFGAEPGDAA